MFNPLADWLDSRTSYKALLRAIAGEPVPRRARWRYVVGAAFASTLFLQVVTGLLLMTTYSPSATTAWGSVYHITHTLDLGWFLRGIHRFATAAMITLIGLHLAMTLVAGAYRAPREATWWLGIVLLLLTMGSGITGNILPWDQRGYWAAVVETTIAGSTPVLGPTIQKVALGGPEPGNLTLTRLYALHVGVLPVALVLVLLARTVLTRRHDESPAAEVADPDAIPAWPRRIFPNMAASAAVLAALVAATLWWHGFPLDAPADPSGNYPARPEWYFLWLFELRHFFPGPLEYLGTIVVPGALMSVLVALPFLDRVLPRRPAHFLACGLVFAVAGSAAFLTFEALRADARDPAFAQARHAADATRDRTLQLAAAEGIPPEGAAYLLSRDPLTRGRSVLEAKCLNCHVHGGPEAKSEARAAAPASPQTAPDLAGFGSYAWIRGLLEGPQSDTFFGKVPACDGMKTWKEQSKLTAPQLDEVARFVSTFAEIDPDAGPADWAALPAVRDHPGRKWFFKKGECADCHSLDGVGSLAAEGTDARPGYMQPAPDLFGWGSNAWTARMIRRPGARHLYGYLAEEQAMPAFADQLTPEGIEAVVRYLRGQYLPPKSAPAAGAKVAAD